MIFSSFYSRFCGNCLVNAVFWWLGCGEKRGKSGLLMVVVFGDFAGVMVLGSRLLWWLASAIARAGADPLRG